MPKQGTILGEAREIKTHQEISECILALVEDSVDLDVDFCVGKVRKYRDEFIFTFGIGDDEADRYEVIVRKKD